MRLLSILLVAALVPLLAMPAAGEVQVQGRPDRVALLVMQGTGFNGLTWPNTPLLEAAVGELVQITVVVPPSAEPHTFHLHGHPWFVPSKKGMIDTVLLDPGDVHSFTVTAGGLAQSPGDWMYHCHFDEHVKGGMWGVFRVYPYAVSVAGSPSSLRVDLDRLGDPVEGATLAVTLDGAPVHARVEALGDGGYAVRTGLAWDATGALVVTASHPLGESVGRLALGGAPAALPSVAVPPGAVGGMRH